MGQNSACEQDRDFAQGQIFTRFDKFHQREQEEKRAMGQLRHVSSTSGLESASTLSKKQRKSIHGTKSISNPSSPLGAKSYSQSLGFPTSHQPFDHYNSVNIIINATNNNTGDGSSSSFNTSSSNNSTISGGSGNNCESPHLLSPATQSAGSAAASSRRRGQSAASPQSNYFVNNTHQTQLMINQDAIEVKKRIQEDSDDEDEDPATVRRSRRKSFSLFKNDKKVDMF